MGPGAVISGPKFSRRQVTSAVLQGSMLGPALFNSSAHEWMMEQSTPSASSQVTQQGGGSDTPEGCATIQRDPAMLRNAQRGISLI